MEITRSVYADPESTGGCPTVPANATNVGAVDPSSLEVGTVISVITKSMSKWVITVLDDGKVDIAHYTWFIDRHYSDAELRRGYLEVSQIIEKYHELYPMFGLTMVSMTNDFRLENRYASQRYDAAGVEIAPFKAGDRLTWNDCGRTSAVVFWSID